MDLPYLLTPADEDLLSLGGCSQGNPSRGQKLGLADLLTKKLFLLHTKRKESDACWIHQSYHSPHHLYALGFTLLSLPSFAHLLLFVLH